VDRRFPSSLQDAARRSGWLAGRSNFLLATSKPMTAAIDDRTAYVSRRDGDGLATILRQSRSEATDLVTATRASHETAE